MGYIIVAVVVYVLIALITLFAGGLAYSSERDYPDSEEKRRLARVVALWWAWPVPLNLFMKEAYKDAGF